MGLNRILAHPSLATYLPCALPSCLLPQQIHQPHTKCVRQTLHVVDGDISFPSFHRSDVRAMEPRDSGQFLLRQSFREPDLTKISRENKPRRFSGPLIYHFP
jgi:hypothetical protein